MQLLQGKSRRAMSANIGELIASGRPKKQAIAIAIHESQKGQNNTAPRRMKVPRQPKAML